MDMRKSGKRLLAILAGAAVLGGTLAGCGGNGTKDAGTTAGTEGTTQQNQGTTASQGDASNLDPVTLHFIFYGDKKSATDQVWDKIAEYTKDKLNADFDVQFIAGSDYTQKLVVKAATGDPWDLNFDSNWTCYYSMVAKDAYMDLTELLPQYAPDLYKKYEEAGLLAAAKNGKGEIVALPWTMTMNNREHLQWRGDLAEKAGITVDKDQVKDWEGIDSLLYQLKEAYPDKYIIENAAIIYAQEGLCELGHGLAFNLNDPACKVVALEDTQSFADTAKYAEKWQNDGLIWKDILTDNLDHNSLINEGKLITKFGTHEFSTQNRAWVEEGAHWDYTLVYPEGLYANRTPLANAMCISATSENPERTLMFLNLLETDKTLYDLVQYGIEGVTYELNGEEAVFPEGMDAASSNYMEWGGRWGVWKPQFMRPDASYGAGFWEKEAEFAASMEQNIVSPLEGFSFDSTNVKNELSRRDQVYNDAFKLIGVGLAGDAAAAVAKLQADAKDAGLETLLAEYQKQVDAFLANK